MVPAAAIAQAPTPDPERPKRLAEGIQDNSFLIEEAYNQEEGVVQHIMNVVYAATRHAGPDDAQLAFVFTQEWPVFSQRHQLSYTLPYSFADSGGNTTNGIQDILLNYRYQAIMETDSHPAFAPRFTLILPTGDTSEGFGNGTVGYQVNLPLSKIVGNRWTLHANAGVTVFPDVEGHDLVSPNLGASAIYAVTANFNLMLESVAFWNERGERPRRHGSSGFSRHLAGFPLRDQSLERCPNGHRSGGPDRDHFCRAGLQRLRLRFV